MTRDRYALENGKLCLTGRQGAPLYGVRFRDLLKALLAVVVLDSLLRERSVSAEKQHALLNSIKSRFNLLGSLWIEQVRCAF